MNRFELWERMKTARLTESTLKTLPKDTELKIVFQHCSLSAEALIDFLCSLDGAPVKPKIKKKEYSDPTPLDWQAHEKSLDLGRITEVSPKVKLLLHPSLTEYSVDL